MAINFPSTAGQATDGSYTYNVAGIIYAWNGSSWSAAGAGASATDRTLFSVTTNPPSVVPALSYNNTNGVFTYVPPDLSGYVLSSLNDLGGLTDVTLSSSSSGQTLKYNGSAWVNSTFAVNDLSDTDIDSGGFNPLSDGDLLQWDGPNSKWINNPNARSVSSTIGAYFGVSQATGNVQIEGLGTGAALELVNGGTDVAISINYNTGNNGDVLTSTGTGVSWTAPSGLQARGTALVTQSIANNAAANISITTPKTYALLKIETSHAAWVTLYTDTTSRTNDANRAETTDPTPGSGVLAEVITTSAATQLITPATVCFNESGSGITYAKVVNKSGSTTNVSVTLTYLQLEA
jgi:hypothetical protein